MARYDLNQKTILIIGGAGFIGAEIIRQLLRDFSPKVLVLDIDEDRLRQLDLPDAQKYLLDASDTAKVASVITKEKVHGIIHLAANSDIKAGSITSDLDFRNTFVTALSISEIVRLRTFDFVLFASTSAVYGDVNTPISLDSGDVRIPISNYGWAKLGGEYSLKLATNKSSTPFILTRFPNVVGPNPTHGVLYDFRKKLKSNNQKLEILGNGEQTKPYLHVEDLCKVLLRSISMGSSQRYTELNIGPGDTISLKEIVNVVLEITGLKPELRFGTTPYGWIGDVPSYTYSDDLPGDYSDLHLRNSKEAIYDAFSGSWID
jgi:UDP-glucose 4-epimerase